MSDEDKKDYIKGEISDVRVTKGKPESKKEIDPFWYGLGILTLFFLLGMIIGIKYSDWSWRKDAVNNGAAIYNSSTGDFEWRRSHNDRNTRRPTGSQDEKTKDIKRNEIRSIGAGSR